MPQLFGPRANLVARASLAASLLVVVGGLWGLMMLSRSSYATGVGIPLAQPVPFSHAHHVAGLGIDCRYCHTTVETAPNAGLPPTETCMTCHSQIWTDAPVLAPIREGFASGEAIPWVRVSRLADFVYFDHSIHIQRGVGCSTCHGAVETMPITWQAKAFEMRFCLDCHREPETALRPRSAVVDMTWQPPPDQAVHGRQLLQAYGIDTKRMLDCSVCHR